MGIISSSPDSLILEIIRLFQNHQYSTALHAIDAVLPKVFTNQELLAFLYLRKADCLDQLSQPHIALEYYELSLAQNVSHITISALVAKGWCHFKLEQFDAALECYEQALEKENNLDKYDSLKEQLLYIFSDFESVHLDDKVQKQYQAFSEALQKRLLIAPQDISITQSSLENKPILPA